MAAVDLTNLCPTHQVVGTVLCRHIAQGSVVRGIGERARNKEKTLTLRPQGVSQLTPVHGEWDEERPVSTSRNMLLYRWVSAIRVPGLSRMAMEQMQECREWRSVLSWKWMFVASRVQGSRVVTPEREWRG
jgi:hypothetical protein